MGVRLAYASGAGGLSAFRERQHITRVDLTFDSAVTRFLHGAVP